MVDQPPGDHIGSGYPACPFAWRIEGTVTTHLRDGMEHEPGLLLGRHLREQILDPLVDRATRIFIRIQAAVLVEIPKGDTVLESKQSWFLHRVLLLTLRYAA